MNPLRIHGTKNVENIILKNSNTRHGKVREGWESGMERQTVQNRVFKERLQQEFNLRYKVKNVVT